MAESYHDINCPNIPTIEQLRDFLDVVVGEIDNGKREGSCDKNHEMIDVIHTSMFDAKDIHYEQCEAGFAFISEDGEPHIVDHIHSGEFRKTKNGDIEIVYYPLKNDTTKHGQIILPTQPEKCDSLTDIINEIEEKYPTWLYISHEEVPIFRVQIRVSIASWFLYVFQDPKTQERVSGLLGIVGPSGGGKKRWLTLHRQIAYRPIYLLNTNKIPSVFRLAEPWGTPTLLIDEADQKDTGSESEWIQFINSRYDGTPIPRYNTATNKTDTFRSFGLTCLALRRMPRDEGNTSRMIKINATISPFSLPEIAGADIYREFESIRNRLFYLRLKFYGKLQFVGTSGLPADHSWRGKETLTLYRILQQIDPKVADDIVQISKALTDREVQNLAGTWDGLIINEIFAYITDTDTKHEEHARGYYYAREWKDKEGIVHNSYLNLKYLADRLGTTASEIQRSIIQFKIGVYDRFRPDEGKPQRGILKFSYPIDTDRVFKRYVPNYQHELLKLVGLQKTLTDTNSEDDHGGAAP